MCAVRSLQRVNRPSAAKRDLCWIGLWIPLDILRAYRLLELAERPLFNESDVAEPCAALHLRHLCTEAARGSSASMHFNSAPAAVEPWCRERWVSEGYSN